MITSAVFTGVFDRTGLPVGQRRLEVVITYSDRGPLPEWILCKGKTLAECTDEVTDIIMERNAAEAADKAADDDLKIPTKLPIPLTRSKVESNPEPTPFEVWRGKAIQVQRAKALGLSGKALAAVAKLESDRDSAYVDGFVDLL
jgi:hypothetical protein